MNKLLILIILGLFLGGCANSQENMIRNFFNLINEKRITEAREMMSDNREWMELFNDVDGIKVLEVEKSIEKNLYKVVFEAEIDQQIMSDTRFIKLRQDNRGVWKIDEIGTGP